MNKLMNPDRTTKSRSVWPTLRVTIRDNRPPTRKWAWIGMWKLSVTVQCPSAACFFKLSLTHVFTFYIYSDIFEFFTVVFLVSTTSIMPSSRVIEGLRIRLLDQPENINIAGNLSRRDINTTAKASPSKQLSRQLKSTAVIPVCLLVITVINVLVTTAHLIEIIEKRWRKKNSNKYYKL